MAPPVRTGRGAGEPHLWLAAAGQRARPADLLPLPAGAGSRAWRPAAAAAEAAPRERWVEPEPEEPDAPFVEPAPTTTTIQAVERRNWTRGLLALAASVALLVVLGFGAATVNEYVNRPPGVVALQQIEDAPDSQTATAQLTDGGMDLSGRRVEVVLPPETQRVLGRDWARKHKVPQIELRTWLIPDWEYPGYWLLKDNRMVSAAGLADLLAGRADVSDLEIRALHGEIPIPIERARRAAERGVELSGRLVQIGNKAQWQSEVSAEH